MTPAIEQHQPVGESRTGIASWDQTRLLRVCASNFHPIGTILRVNRPGHSENTITVRVVGTGPRPDLGRIIDLSPDAFWELAPLATGIITVEVTPLKE